MHERAVANAGPLVALSLLGRLDLLPLPDPLLVAELDPGEAAVISMARHLSPCVAVIDERRGRRIATSVYGLPVKGTVGLLIEARRRNLSGNLRPMLLALKAAGYFISDAIVDAACRSVGE